MSSIVIKALTSSFTFFLPPRAASSTMIQQWATTPPHLKEISETELQKYCANVLNLGRTNFLDPKNRYLKCRHVLQTQNSKGDLLTRLEAASMVPPVANRSSTMSTLAPGLIAPSCTWVVTSVKLQCNVESEQSGSNSSESSSPTPSTSSWSSWRRSSPPWCPPHTPVCKTPSHICLVASQPSCNHLFDPTGDLHVKIFTNLCWFVRFVRFCKICWENFRFGGSK